VAYSTSYWQANPGSADAFQEYVWANATWTWHNGDWTGSCTAHAMTETNGNWTNTTSQTQYTPAHPPHWPLFDTTHPPAVGGTIQAWTLERCSIISGNHTFQGRQGNAYLASDTYGNGNFQTHWDPATGLVIDWKSQGAASSSSGQLTKTDAPLD
jgi:hypothetical protein